MPLPDNGPISLQVNSNAVQSKPKRAMIVRMSAETLDALETFPNNAPMYFDFGDVPGISIGDSFFPMRPQKESSPHELYLRAASAAKPMAPLKLYANVIGKFMVERQLGEKVTDKVRQQTMVAKQLHMERQAILLDQPPIPAPGAKNAKRKLPGSGTVVKKTPASDQLRVPPSSAIASRKVSPLPQNTSSSRANADVRRRLVHCLAISPRLSDEAVKLVGGANIAESARDDLLALLEDVAEQQTPPKKGDKSHRPWTLKPQTWTEVRPFEWPKLTEQERVAMARQARMIFKALRIPESDPAWDNVRYRPTAPIVPTPVPAPSSITASASSKPSASAQPESKRSGISSKDAKLKSKHDATRAKGEILVKDESSKATVARVNAIKREEADRPSPLSDSASGSKTIASRRLPGSGYQAKKSPQPSTAVAEKSGNPVDPRTAPKSSLPPSLPPKPSSSEVAPSTGTHARKTIPTIQPKPTKKEDESDRERDKEYERQREREREKRIREKEKQREERKREQELVEMEKRERAKQKEREAVEREKRQRDKERERDEMEQERRQREKERVPKVKAAVAVSAFKRKAPSQDTEDTLDDVPSKTSLPKRRKLDDGTPVASSSKARDAGLPKKPVHDHPSPTPRLKMKKDPSPPQVSVPSQERRAIGGSTHKSELPTKASGSTKPRRRSPIYTSSEDEGEIPQSRKRNPSLPPISDRSVSSDQLPAERAPRPHRTTRTVYPAATDHAALRTLYQTQYSNYLGAFSKIVAQKRKIEAILNGDSEGEVEVMDQDDLIKLSDEHKSLKTELEHIHEIYTKGTTRAVAAGGGGGGSASD